MKLNKRGRKNRIISRLRAELAFSRENEKKSESHAKYLENWIIEDGSKSAKNDKIKELEYEIKKLKGDNQELLEYKAKYYNLIKNLKI